MALDPTIALQAQPPSFDTALKPVASLLGIAGAQQQLQTGRLQQDQLQGQLQERENLSKIDWNKFRDQSGNLDPVAAGNAAMQAAPGFYGPQIAKQMNELAKDSITMKKGIQDLNQQQLEQIGSGLYSLADKQDLGRNDVLGWASQFVEQHPNTAPLVMTALKYAPQTDNPKAWQDWATRQRNGVLKPSEQGNDLNFVNAGGQTNIVSSNKFGIGVPKVVGTMNNTLSPSEASQMVEVTNPDGSVKLVPKAQAMQQNGLGALLPPQMQTQQSQQPNPQAGVQPGGMGTQNGRYPGGGFQIKPPSGVVDANQRANAAGGDLLVADQKSNAESNTRINMLQNAAAALGRADSGQNADKLQAMRGTLVTLGLATPDQANKVQSYDEASKYLTQYAQQKAASFGHGTDAQLSAAMTGNGSTHISNLAAQDVVKVNMALERMDQARMKAWESANLPASQYAKWKSQFGSTMDPRVFVADQLDPSKVQAMVKSMNPKEQATFRTQYNWAVQNGFINGPQ